MILLFIDTKLDLRSRIKSSGLDYNLYENLSGAIRFFSNGRC